MTTKVLSNRDFAQNEIQNVRLQNLASAPSGPVAGQVYYDTTLACTLIWNGIAWRPADASKLTDGSILISALATNPLARTNHTGSQIASTISDLATVVQAYHLNQFAGPTANIAMLGFTFTGLPTPTAAGQAATYEFVIQQTQASAAGISSKDPVRLVSVASLSLTGAATVDGVAVVTGDRILAVGQGGSGSPTTSAANGVYIANTGGAWTRSVQEGATNAELDPGALWLVLAGTGFGGSQWRLTTTGAITPGTTPVNIVQYGAGSVYTFSNGVQLIGSVVSAQVVGGGGILAGGSGLQVDTAVVARKFNQTLATSAASYVITHNLGTKDVMVSIREVSTDNGIEFDWQATSVNTVTVSFASAQAANAMRVTIIG